MTLSYIKQFFTKNKKIFYYIGFFVVVYLLSSVIVSANGSVAAVASTTTTEQDLVNKIIVVLEGLLKGISVLLALITFLATLFLSPEWVNGSIFGLDTQFKVIWIMVSNLVYFAFAFILIWIAFMNIIGKSADQYQLKQALPKFIVGVLIVPFSWFFIQFILSISAILTISALSLPFDTFSDFKSTLDEVRVPKMCTVDLTSIRGGEIETETKSESFIHCPKEKDTDLASLQTLLDGGNAIESIFGIISMYTYGIISFDTIGGVDKFDFKNIHDLGDLTVKIIFDLLFVIVYSVLMITLGMVLMIRGIYIWIYIMISPVFGLMYFFDKKEGGGEGFLGKFNLKEFIALAMIPVYTMLALSFGLLFLFTIGTGLKGTNVSSLVKIVTVEKGNHAIQIGDFKLVIKGAVAKEGKDVTGLIDKIGGGALGIVGALIMKIFGIVILWGTVLAAMRASEITKQITQPIQDFGGKVGSIMASAPGNIPIFGGHSMNSMSTAAGNISSSITTNENRRGAELSGKFIGGTDQDKKYREIGATAPADGYAAFNNIKDLNKNGKAKDIANSTEAINAYVKNLQKMLEMKLLKDTDEVKKAIEGIKNGRGNPQAIMDNLSILDKNATDSRYSILGGNKNIEKGQVDENLGTSVDTSDINSETTNNEIKLNINTPRMAQLMERGASESEEFNETDIKDLAVLLYTQVKSQGGLEKFTDVDFKEKITTDLNIGDTTVLQNIVKGINNIVKENNKAEGVDIKFFKVK